MHDMIKLVFKRCKLMNQIVVERPSAMLGLLGITLEEANDICTKFSKFGDVYVSNINCPGNITLAGDSLCIKKITNDKKINENFLVVKLPTSGAWHCKLMLPGVKKLSEMINEINFKEPKIPIYENIKGEILAFIDIKKNILDHLICAVNWHKVIKSLIFNKTSLFIECSDFKILSSFGPYISRTTKFLNINEVF